MMDRDNDERIAEDVRAILAWDSRLEASSIRVAVDDGVVTLSGTVDLFSERAVAADDAWRVKGVRQVVNCIARRE